MAERGSAGLSGVSCGLRPVEEGKWDFCVADSVVFFLDMTMDHEGWGSHALYRKSNDEQVRPCKGAIDPCGGRFLTRNSATGAIHQAKGHELRLRGPLGRENRWVDGLIRIYS